MKKLSVFLIVLSVAFSAFGAVTWTWSSPYRNTYGFRYQFDTDQGDNWTYVSSDVRSLSLDSVPNNTTLYVQLSVDGLTWSPSAIATYVAEAAESDADAEQERTISIVGSSEPRRNRNFEFALDMAAGADILMGEDFSAFPYLGLSLDFKNIYSPSYWFGLGARVNAGSTSSAANLFGIFSESFSFSSLGAYLDLSLAMSFIIAESTDLTLLLGAGLTGFNTPAELFQIGGYDFGSYLLGGVTLDQYLGPMFHIGLSYSYKFFFGNAHVHSAGLRFGLTF